MSADIAVLAANVKQLEGQKTALETDLAQLANDRSEAILARIRKRFVEHETHRLKSALGSVVSQIESAKASLAAAQAAAPAPSAPATPPVPGLA